MFKNPTPTPNGIQCGREASAVVPWPVVLAAVPLEVERGEVDPELARRMRDDRMRTPVQPSVPLLVPRVDVREAEVAASGFDEEGGDHSSSLHALLARRCFSASPSGSV